MTCLKSLQRLAAGLFKYDTYDFLLPVDISNYLPWYTLRTFIHVVIYILNIFKRYVFSASYINQQYVWLNILTDHNMFALLILSFFQDGWENRKFIFTNFEQVNL